MSQALPYHATRTRPVTRQGKAQTDSEDQDGEQQTTPPTPRVRCSIHPDPPAYQEPVQASRPKGHLKVSQSTGRDSPPGPTLPRNRPSQVTRQGKTRTNSEDQDGEQQTNPPTPQVCCSNHPDPQAYWEPVQASRPMGQTVKVSNHPEKESNSHISQAQPYHATGRTRSLGKGELQLICEDQRQFKHRTSPPSPQGSNVQTVQILKHIRSPAPSLPSNGPPKSKLV